MSKILWKGRLLSEYSINELYAIIETLIRHIEELKADNDRRIDF